MVLLALVAGLPLAGSALVVARSYSNATYDDDNATTEDASSSQKTIGTVNSTVSSVGGASSAQGYQFIGQVAGQDTGIINQYINVTVTWTVNAQEWEEYSITISPELHAWLYIWDWSTDETDDSGVFSSLNSTLKVNGITVSDSLNGLTGYTRSVNGGANLDKTGSQTLSGYSGNNTFSLQLTGTNSVTPHADGGLFDNPTAVAILWGQNGTLNFPNDSTHDNFDEYSTTADRDADGIFVDAVVTLNAVPEPASIMMLVFGGGLIALHRRFFSKI